jgi:hypothetical protein
MMHYKKNSKGSLMLLNSSVPMNLTELHSSVIETDEPKLHSSV